MTRIRSVVLALVALGCLPTFATAQNPSPQQNDAWRQRGPCHDPWINMAFYALESRSPRGSGDKGECDPVFYRAGSWSSYPELYFAVRETLAGFTHSRIRVEFSADASKVTGQPGSSEVAFINLDNNQPIGHMHLAASGHLISKGGAGIEADVRGRIVAAGGGNIVAAGGGNIVAAGGGNIVAAGGGNIVAAGGGNIVAAGGGNLQGGPARYAAPGVRTATRITSTLMLR